MGEFTKVLILDVLMNIFQNMIHPVTPTLLTELGMPDYLFGVIFACMAVGMLLTSPYLGRLSDRKGRRIVFIITNTIYSVGQMMFFYGKTELMLMLARMLAGVGCGGTLVALTAWAVDSTDESNRASRLSVFAAVSTVSAALGFFLGGMLGTLSIGHTFISQCIFLTITSIISYFLMPGTVPEPVKQSSVSVKQKITIRDILSLMTMPLVLFLLCTAFANLSTYGYDNAFNYYIKRELDFPSSYNGMIKAVTGLLGLLATLFINRALIKHFAVDKVLSGVLAACALTLGIFLLMDTVPLFIGMSMLFCLANAMYQPLLQSLMTRASDCDFGLLSGMFNSARSVGMIIGATCAGFLYSVSPKAPFVMATICFVAAMIVSVLFSGVINTRGKKSKNT